ncbi:MAG: insulinase family protein [Myxococcales bacterium]|nr:insulinase family protein [Myxococcales bacterium]
MDVILVEHRGLPIVQLTLYFQGGPAFDPPGREGLTALTNRALLRGTKRRGRAELEEAIESLGADLITSTQTYAVSLGGTVLTRHLPAYLALLGEVLTEPLLAADEIEKVKREMLAELEAARDDDSYLARMWFRRQVFAGHPLGHGGNGSKESLSAITPADVAAHYRRTYCRANLLVGSAGEVDEKTLHGLLADAIGKLPEGAPLRWALPDPPAREGRRVTLVDKADRSQAQILLGHPTIAAADPAFIPLYLATTAFGGTFTARLMQEVRVKRGWSYGAYARLGVERTTGAYMLSAAPSAEYAVEALGLLLSEYDRFVDEGLDDDEVAFARDHLIHAFPFSIETAALRAAQRVRARLLGRPEDYVETYLADLAKPTADEVRAAVRRHLTPADLEVVMVCTADAATRAAVAALPGVTAVEVHSADEPA